MTLVYAWHDSPIGALLLAGDGTTLHRISFPAGSRRIAPDAAWRRDDAAFGSVRAALDAYFAGKAPAFDMPLSLNGTAFQRRVWSALRDIPYGETISYGALAAAIGHPTGSRAVGAANGANPIPIIVPCHRVIGASGRLTGFGGGLPTKAFLLELEGAAPAGAVRQGELPLAAAPAMAAT